MKKFLRVLISLSLAVLLCATAVSAVEVLDNMDPVGETTASKLGFTPLDTENQKEGAGCFTYTGTGPVWYSTTLEGDSVLDLSAYETDLVLDFWLYIDDIDAFNGGSNTDGQFELTSSGECDKEELSWMMEDESWVTGWNHVVWTLDDAKGNDLNFSAVNFIRVYKFMENTTCRIDNLRIAHQSEYGIGEQYVNRSSETLLDFDHFGDEDDVILGENCLEGKGNPAVAQKKYDTAIDLTKWFDAKDVNGDCDGYIYFWLYLEGYDPEKKAETEGQLELTSSGECDKAETHIGVYQMKETLQNGWNEVLIPLSAFVLESSDDTTFDPASVNFFRMYFFGESEITIKIDNVKFGLSEDFGIQVKKNETEAPETKAPVETAKDTSKTETKANETKASTGNESGNTGLIIGIVVAVVVIAAIVVFVVVKKKKQQ